ncbi:hypothetical protein ANCCAN_21598 [Ancylostoma caninum]|uniref:Uncharacterized protein n=1 Tax=Ancylostoma caninum TaxID=29170 RepID=A0A368FM33_ANCCA|nr:hypothetical protein ANCCAN_21598 [Ancylostoma caninum]
MSNGFRQRTIHTDPDVRTVRKFSTTTCKAAGQEKRRRKYKELCISTRYESQSKNEKGLT